MYIAQVYKLIIIYNEIKKFPHKKVIYSWPTSACVLPPLNKLSTLFANRPFLSLFITLDKFATYLLN